MHALVDLRLDTPTTPTPAMRAAMAGAEVGLGAADVKRAVTAIREITGSW